MNRLQKLRIAKIAYRDIKSVIEKWDDHSMDLPICFHWDGCITVDDELFHEHELREIDDNI